MALIVYGHPDSRTMRVLWAARELDIDFTHVPIRWDDPKLKEPGYLKINPAGAIPAIDDDGFVLAESLAIILYLAKKYGRAPLYPATPQGEAEVWRWALWAQVAVEPFVQADVRMAPLRAAMGDLGKAEAERGCALLETTLAARPWLLGEDFTAADLCVAAILSPSRAARVPLNRFPRLRDWHLRCYHRPAALATRGPHPADADPSWPAV